jgi:hypothetical protein
MTSRVSHTTIDSRNAYQQSVWWAQVLGMREDRQDPNEGNEFCVVRSDREVSALYAHMIS